MLKLISVSILACACAGSSTSPAPRRTVDPIPMTTARSAPAHTVLAAYERTRAMLAADDITGLPSAARELEAAARTAGFSAMVDPAAKLASAADLEAARVAFGEVSHHLIAVLARDLALAEGQHVFECPMVKGYKKWVQPSAELQNPYMGQRMLACGGESTWD